MAKKRKQYRLTRDIVIPAGTKVDVEPPHGRSYFCERASILNGETKDITSEWSIPLDEALEIGLVEEVPDAS